LFNRTTALPDTVKLVDGLEFYIALSEAHATHEVIVLSRYDADFLSREVVRQKSSAKTLKENMLAEMLEEMVSAIKADSERKAFVFARKL
jgi:DNA-binding NarL/FixJ family response regulator